MTHLPRSLRIHSTWKVGHDLTDEMRMAITYDEVICLANDPTPPGEPVGPLPICLLHWPVTQTWWHGMRPAHRVLWTNWLKDTLEHDEHDVSAAAYFHQRKRAQG